MALVPRLLLVILLIFFFLPLSLSYGEGAGSGETGNVVLSPADQMILEAIAGVNDRIDKLSHELNGRIDKLGHELNGRIDKLGHELNGRIDKLNERIDNLWITMLGGFLGVMAFIGGIVFWDRRTFSRRAKDEFRDELSGDREKLEAMLVVMRKLSDRFPEVREVLKSFGLL